MAANWSATFTTELLELVNVVGLLGSEEATQVKLLKQVLALDQVTETDLVHAGLLPPPSESRKAPKVADSTEATLF